MQARIVPFAGSQMAFAANGANEGGVLPPAAGVDEVVVGGPEAFAAPSSAAVGHPLFPSVAERFSTTTVPADFMKLRAGVRDVWANIPNPSYWSVDNIHVPADGPVKRLDPFERWQTGDYKKLKAMLELLVNSRLKDGVAPRDVSVLIAKHDRENWHAMKILLDMGVTVVSRDTEKVQKYLLDHIEGLSKEGGYHDDLNPVAYYRDVNVTMKKGLSEGRLIFAPTDKGGHPTNLKYDIGLWVFPYDMMEKMTDNMKDDSIMIYQASREIAARDAMFTGFAEVQNRGWQTLLHVDVDDMRNYLAPGRVLGIPNAFLRIFKRIGYVDNKLSQKLGEFLVPLGNMQWNDINRGAESMTLEAMEKKGLNAKVVFNDYWGHDQLTDVWVYMSEVREQLRDRVLVDVANGATKVEVSLDVAKRAIVVKSTFGDKTFEGFMPLMN